MPKSCNAAAARLLADRPQARALHRAPGQACWGEREGAWSREEAWFAGWQTDWGGSQMLN